jgi:hypothetical protein
VSGVPDDVTALVQTLVEGDEQARGTAADQLAAMGPEASVAVPALVQALPGADQPARETIVGILGQFGPQAAQAVPALIQTLQDDSEAVRTTAAGALTAITGQDFGIDASLWQQWWDEQQAASQADTGGGPLDFPTPLGLDHWEPIGDGQFKALIVVRISGGVPPFMVYHDLETFLTGLRDYPLEFTTGVCTLNHSIRVDSTDGQSVSHDYWIDAPWCD